MGKVLVDSDVTIKRGSNAGDIVGEEPLAGNRELDLGMGADGVAVVPIV